uniref:OsmC family peroxiredoxin n=1 Tax=Dictyoglomus thermophilum TaxID=14 RepID=A0A7C3MRQ4_DICTH
MGKVTFKAEGKWLGNLKVEAKIRDKFIINMDEPPSLGGEDTAPNPVEVVLAALIGCLGIVIQVVAKEKNIPLQNVEIYTEGDLDPRGFMGDPNIRAGYDEVRVRVKIETPVDKAKIEELMKEVERRCPVSDIIKNPVNLKISLE